MPVYLGFFVLVGAAILGFFIIFWLINRIFTRLQSPPSPRLTSYFAFCASPIIGINLALIPSLLVFGLFVFIFQVLMAFEQVNEEYTSFGSPSSWANSQRTAIASLLGISAYNQVSRGRLAVVFATFGFYMVFLTARNLIPHKISGSAKSMFDPLSQENDNLLLSQSTRTTRWYRTQYLFAAVLTCLVQAVILEYSYSAYFQATLYDSLLAMVIFNHVFQAALETILDDSLLAQPFIISAALIETLALMGAANFLDFMQCYVIYSLIKISFRIYVNPWITYALENLSYIQALLNRYMEINSRKADMEEGEDDDDDDDLFAIEFQRISPAEYIIKMLTLYSIQSTSYFTFPILVLFIWWAEGLGLQIGSNYGIQTSGLSNHLNYLFILLAINTLMHKSDFIYYFAFSSCMIPFCVLVDTFVQSAAEFFHGQTRLFLYFFLFLTLLVDFRLEGS